MKITITYDYTSYQHIKKENTFLLYCFIDPTLHMSNSVHVIYETLSPALTHG